VIHMLAEQLARVRARILERAKGLVPLGFRREVEYARREGVQAGEADRLEVGQDRQGVPHAEAGAGSGARDRGSDVPAQVAEELGLSRELARGGVYTGQLFHGDEPRLCEGCWRGEHWMTGEVWCVCCADEHRMARGIR